MGELNWIFTAITDTIAWNVLPQKLFQRLFREDLLLASLFRNYLLAERIMRSCKVRGANSFVNSFSAHQFRILAYRLRTTIQCGKYGIWPLITVFHN